MEQSTWEWPKPELTRAGQTAFWNRQAGSYEQADMTVDNEGELEAVLEQLRLQPLPGEIIVLGGAVGCRDPKVILQQLYCQTGCEGCSTSGPLPQVFLIFQETPDGWPTADKVM